MVTLLLQTMVTLFLQQYHCTPYHTSYVHRYTSTIAQHRLTPIGVQALQAVIGGAQSREDMQTADSILGSLEVVI